MPSDTALAQQIGQKLALYAGRQVAVTHAGRFRYGDQWRKRVQEELNNAHWLIFLFTDQDEDWGFCLFECGYFRGTMETDTQNKKRLITFCRRPEQINDALKEFNALVIEQKTVTELLQDIYSRDPWRINPELDPAVLGNTANDIVKAFLGSERVEQNFDVSPSVTLELELDDAIKQGLQCGRLPEGMQVTGTKDWQRLFGRDINTGGWVWKQLAEGWPYVEVYEFLLAKMIADALDGRPPKGANLRSPSEDSKDNGLYRLTLRRYERMGGGNRYRFHFTAASLNLPFDLPDPGGTAEETILFHLINLTWHFRRRIVDRLYERLLGLNGPPPPDEDAVEEVYDQLGRELMQVNAQALIRQLDNIHKLRRALGQDGETQALLKRLEPYQQLEKNVFSKMEEGRRGLGFIVGAVHEMAVMNFDLYRAAAQRYALVARSLPSPDPPPVF
jgi:hypothetical protein